jgi:hypothetical protein
LRWSAAHEPKVPFGPQFVAVLSEGSPPDVVASGWQRAQSLCAALPFPCIPLCHAPAGGLGGLPWQAMQRPVMAFGHGGVVTGTPPKPTSLSAGSPSPPMNQYWYVPAGTM